MKQLQTPAISFCLSLTVNHQHHLVTAFLISFVFMGAAGHNSISHDMFPFWQMSGGKRKK